MRIGELATRTGVSERSLRYYEDADCSRPTARAAATATTPRPRSIA